MNLIEKQKAVNTVLAMYERCDTGSMEDFRELMIGALEVLPEVEAEPVRHGKWLDREDDYDNYVVCSECGDEYIEDNELGLASWVKQYFKYCPYCGAKMDAERKEE